MRKLIITLGILALSAGVCQAQTYKINGYTYEKTDDYTITLTHPAPVAPTDNLTLKIVDRSILGIQNAIASCDKVIAKTTAQKEGLEARLAIAQGIKTNMVETVGIIEEPEPEEVIE